MLSRNSAQQPRVRLASTAPAWWSGFAILAGVLAFFPSAARAANAGWYAAVDAGQSRFTNIATYRNPVYPDSLGSTDAGYRLGGGYQFNSYFGLEASYVHLGGVTGSYTNPGSGFCGLCAQSYIVNGELKTHGWTLELVGAYPFNDRWAIFARAGEIEADSELNADYTPIPPYYCLFCENSSVTSSDVDVTYGMGVRWSFTQHWAARLSWDRYVSLGYKLPVDGFNINLAAIGIVYQF
ncbi:MAG: outer membrane beta-barrel protein [Gammaproteobacteria bacterium]|nr:outer membrane beta-barrel protein [Gammaproteobacteria bacterium]